MELAVLQADRLESLTSTGPWSMGMFPRGIQAVSMRAERPMKTLSMCRPVNSWSPTARSHLYAGVTTCAPCKQSSHH